MPTSPATTTTPAPDTKTTTYTAERLLCPLQEKCDDREQHPEMLQSCLSPCGFFVGKSPLPVSLARAWRKKPHAHVRHEAKVCEVGSL